MAQRASSNQPIAVPVIVMHQFNQSHLNISNVVWAGNGENYTAVFVQDGQRKNVVYTPSGQWIMTEMPVRERELPYEVSSSIRQHYAGYNILSAFRVETSRQVSFRVRLKRGGVDYEVEVDLGGRVRETRRVPVVVYEEDDDDCDHSHHHKHKHKKKKKHKHSHCHDDCDEWDD